MAGKDGKAGAEETPVLDTEEKGVGRESAVPDNSGVKVFLLLTAPTFLLIALTAWKNPHLRFPSVVIAAALTVVTLWKILRWHLAPSNFQERKDFLQLLAQIVGGLALIFGLFFTWWNLQVTQKTAADSLGNAQKNLTLAQEGQITERFTRAVDQLGSEKMEIRLGGIYALERIARDSDKDYETILEILTAFVREHTPRKEDDKSTNDVEPRTDIQAILTVLGRRPKPWTIEMGISRMLNLNETDLRGINLSDAHFEGTFFFRANLKGSMLGGHFRSSVFNQAVVDGSNLNGDFQSVNFNNASLRQVWFNSDATHASFSSADLQEAILSRSNFQKAVFDNAHLEKAYMEGADLREAILIGAFLDGARLTGARLEGANLSEVKGLTVDQIKGAYLDGATKLPDYITAALQAEQKPPLGGK
ncbi:MAG: pentapeptide repeat-containing protein [Acidobacteriota bacterium]|nr:pentapeptide repeat-containing protein [Acidobacteriota bacterium]